VRRRRRADFKGFFRPGLGAAHYQAAVAGERGRKGAAEAVARARGVHHARRREARLPQRGPTAAAGRARRLRRDAKEHRAAGAHGDEHKRHARVALQGRRRRRHFGFRGSGQVHEALQLGFVGRHVVYVGEQLPGEPKPLMRGHARALSRAHARTRAHTQGLETHTSARRHAP
jgi:hypothetical protein